MFLILLALIAILIIGFIPSGPACPSCGSHATGKADYFDEEDSKLKTLLGCYSCGEVIKDYKQE